MDAVTNACARIGNTGAWVFSLCDTMVPTAISHLAEFAQWLLVHWVIVPLVVIFMAFAASYVLSPPSEDVPIKRTICIEEAVGVAPTSPRAVSDHSSSAMRTKPVVAPVPVVQSAPVHACKQTNRTASMSTIVDVSDCSVKTCSFTCGKETVTSESKACDTLRSHLEHEYPEIRGLYSDAYLARVLSVPGRAFEYARDEKIAKALQWRRDFGVEKLVRSIQCDDGVWSSSDAEASPALLETCLEGFLQWKGTDGEGRPVLYCQTSLVDWRCRGVEVARF